MGKRKSPPKRSSAPLPDKKRVLVAFQRVAKEHGKWPLAAVSPDNITPKARVAALLTEIFGLLTQFGLPGLVRLVQLAHNDKDIWPENFSAAHAEVERLLVHALGMKDADATEVADPRVLDEWSADFTSLGEAAMAKKKDTTPVTTDTAPATRKGKGAVTPKEAAPAASLSDRDIGYTTSVYHSLADLATALGELGKKRKVSALTDAAEHIDEALELLVDIVGDEE